jgi:hypothetical protein
VNAIAPRARADGHDRVADTFGGREDEIRLVQQPYTHRVDERIPFVGRIEDDLAAHGRDADAIPVVADSLDDAREEMAHARRVERSEAQRVQQRDRTRAHREHVAQDAADAGRCALIRLDRRRMIVRLDLEGDREPVTDRDHAGVLARALQYVGRLRWQRLEMRARVLVRAVLVPERAHDSELREGRRATEQRDQSRKFVLGQSMLGDERRRDDRVAGAGLWSGGH